MPKVNFQKKLNLTGKIGDVITTFSRSRSLPANIVQRARIIYMANAGYSTKDIDNETRLDIKHIRKWLKRFIDALERLRYIESTNVSELETEILNVLSDLPRTGKPRKFTDEQRMEIVKIACNFPRDYGFPLGKWSLITLSSSVVNIGSLQFVNSISPSTIQRILNENRVKPHKSQYWMHSKDKDEDPEQFKIKIKTINEIYQLASILRDENPNNIHIYSTDEMTGIQALERKAPDKPTIPNGSKKIEFEYIRHGTTSYIGFMNCINGELLEPYLNGERKESDFVTALDMAIKEEGEYIIVSDNLNTHYSESLVRYVAKKIKYNGDLGKKGVSGILQNKKSRIDFLTDKSHSIRFVYTPKHCSWMNQIEVLFGVMNKRLLKVESFKSVKDLTESIRRYIKFHNKYWAKPFNWTYNTTPLGD